MTATRSIVDSIDQERRRRVRIRADQLKVTVPALAAAVLASAVDQVDATEDSPEQGDSAVVPELDELIQRIRAAHPGFRTADIVPRSELYARTSQDLG